MNKLLRSCFIFIRSLGRISTLSALCGIAESLAAPQSIDWTSPTNGSVLRLNQTHPLTATASSGLPVTFRVANGPAEISNGMVTATNSGTVVVVAEQAGDAEYSPASLARTFNQPSVQLSHLGSYRYLSLLDPAEDIKVVGSLAFVPRADAGLLILDVSDPKAPSQVGSYQTPGTADAVDVIGDLAFVADNDGGLHILDVSNPATPIRVGGSKTGARAIEVQVVNGLAYVVNWHTGLLILDVSNPAGPLRTVGYFADKNIHDVHVVGNFAYIVGNQTGLQILDVSEPTVPRKVGAFPTSGDGIGVQVADGVAYLADGSLGLQVVDVREPTTPVRVGRYDTRGTAFAVQVVGDRVFVCDFDRGLQVLDVSDRTAPALVGSLDTSGTARAAQVVGNHVYLADGETGVEVLQFREGVPQTLTWSTPADGAVLRVGQPYPMTATAASGLPVTFRVAAGPASIEGEMVVVTNAGTIKLIAEQQGDATHLPVSEARSLNRSFVQTGLLSSSGIGGVAHDIQVSGGIGYVAAGVAGLQIKDLSNPAAPTHIGGYASGTIVYGVRLAGHLAYLATSRGLEILDVTRPATPTPVGVCSIGDFGRDLRLVDNRAYLMTDNRLEIIDITNPATPVRLGSNWPSGDVNGADIVGNLAYVTRGPNKGLDIVDVGNPAKPVPLGRGFILRGGKGVQVVQNLAFVAARERGLQILDISNPAAPMAVGSYITGGDTQGITVVGNLAFLAEGAGRLQIVDVSRPAFPVLAGSHLMPGSAGRVQVVDNVAFVAAGEAGIHVVHLREWIKQTLTWSSPTNGAVLEQNQAYRLQASASSGLPVSFRLLGGPAAVQQETVTITNIGNVTLIAEQAGDEWHLPLSANIWVTTSSIFTTTRLDSFGLVLEWVGGRAPFTIMKRDTLEATPVENGVTYDRAFPVSADGFGGFYQVRGAP